jgi:hypothetical protein
MLRNPQLFQNKLLVHVKVYLKDIDNWKHFYSRNKSAKRAKKGGKFTVFN